MPLTSVTLEPKQPWEQLPYTFDLRRAVPSTEEFSTVAFAIYDDDDDPASPTDLASTMIDTVGFSNVYRTVTAEVLGGTSGKTYVLRFRLQCVTGDKYEGEGRIKCLEVG